VVNNILFWYKLNDNKSHHLFERKTKKITTKTQTCGKHPYIHYNILHVHLLQNLCVLVTKINKVCNIEENLAFSISFCNRNVWMHIFGAWVVVGFSVASFGGGGFHRSRPWWWWWATCMDGGPKRGKQGRDRDDRSFAPIGWLIRTFS
jgi:hypothetical protein